MKNLILDEIDIAWGIKQRRILHRIPELGFELPRTRQAVLDGLAEAGVLVDPKPYGRCGVVAVVEGDRPGPTTLLRADMDALPIPEVSGRSWGSTIDGNSHACGHDGHMAVMLAVAKTLQSKRRSFSGRAVFCFQPSEEPGGGALAMIADGILETYRPDRCLGVHLWSELEVGTFSVPDGGIFGASDKLTWVLNGPGGHGAAPHLAADTVGALAELIQRNAQTVARSVDPLESAVISIGTINGGTAHNVIPQTITVKGTLRTRTVSVRSSVIQRLETISASLGDSFDIDVNFSHEGYVPPCINEPKIAAAIRDIVQARTHADWSLVDYKSLASDDMGEFLARVPGCYFFVGCGSKVRNIVAPHHTSEFDLDEESISIATDVLLSFVLNY